MADRPTGLVAAVTPGEQLREAHRGGVLLALVALRNTDEDLLNALADDHALLELVERGARESRGGTYSAALRVSLQLIARCGADVVARSRADRHRRIAAAIAAGGSDADRLIASARAVCATWRAERLVSTDYSEAWERLLQSSHAAIAAALVDQSPDAYPFRQASAFIRSPEWYAVTPALVPSIVDSALTRIQPGQLDTL